MLKKPLIFVCMTAIVFLLICGCAAKQEASLPQLVIGCNNYEPYYYADADGEPAGMDVDLAKEACARMGYVPVFRQINWISPKTANPRTNPIGISPNQSVNLYFGFKDRPN